MVHLTYPQRELLKKAVITAGIHRLTISETCDMVRDKLGLEMSFDYIAHLKADLKKDTKKKLDLYKKDKFAFVEEIFFKRVAELEDSQVTLQNIIDNSKDDEIRIKAISELTNISTLISNYYLQLPNFSSLGVDAFTSNDKFVSNSSNGEAAVITTTKEGKEEDYNKNNGEWAV
jgi:hypothetical protein